MQPTNMKPQKYADYLAGKLFKVADVDDEGKLNNVFIEGVDSTISHCSQQYWAQNLQVGSAHIAFVAESLMPVQKGVEVTSTINQNTGNQETA